MVKYKIELLPVANDDLHDIFDYILLDNPTAANEMLNEIMASIECLENFPKLGIKLTQDSLKQYSFRMVIINPYSVFYRFLDSKVYIYRVLHGARDYKKILKGESQTRNE